MGKKFVAPEGQGLPLESVINGVTKGTFMYKLRSGDRFYLRHFFIDVENLRLHYRPSKKCFGRRNNYIDIREIEEVRKGWSTDIFNSLAAKLRKRINRHLHRHLCSMHSENNCFSVVTGPAYKTWDFVAPNEATRNAWVRGLNHLVATNRNVHRQQEYNRWLIEQVQSADVNNNGSLNFKECVSLLKQLNISMDRKHVKVLFDKANFHQKKIDGEDALDAEEFVAFYHSLLSRPEIEGIMKKYSVGNSMILETEGLHAFLTKDQKMADITLEDCQAIIDKFEPDQQGLNGYMTLRGFREMLLSKDFDIFNHDHCVVYQDMTYPLSHYYIASSHNTYLVHGQLIGDSSIEGYIQALMKGCRCVELDVWDGPGNDPIIVHGHTLTSEILFRDVLEAIKKYAFKISQYPVILSLENHCSVLQQKKMAEHLINILGDALYCQPVKKDEFQLPSPEALEYKIILKGKKLEEEGDESNIQDILNEEEQSDEEVESDNDDEILEDGSKLSAPKKELAKELSDIINYCKSVKFHSFQTVKDKWKFYEMASFEESKSLSLAQNKEKEYIGYNKKHLSRIYPKGTRTDSSNYDPIPHWNVGCQLVALNYQTYDKPMIVYTAKFLQNGRCGYILKSDYLCTSNDENKTTENFRPQCKKVVEIKVISGQHIPKPHQSLEGEVVDPYVIIKVFGHEEDKQKFKTKYLNNNGFNPVWNETFVIEVNFPELAIVLFTVKDKNWTGKDLILAHYALPFSSITEGYRHIHLLDNMGQPLVPASLFVHINIVKYSNL